MKPDEWAQHFRDKHPKASIPELVEALRSAAKFEFWHSPDYAELVINHLEKLN